MFGRNDAGEIALIGNVPPDMRCRDRSSSHRAGGVDRGLTKGGLQGAMRSLAIDDPRSARLSPVYRRHLVPNSSLRRHFSAKAPGCTSRRRPVSTSKIKPRTGISLAIQGCDLTLSICSRVFCSGSR